MPGSCGRWPPKAVGGDEVDLSEFHDAVRTLTKACPSTGWVAGVLGIHPPAVPHFNPEVQKEIWAHGPDVVLGSSGSPLIKAKPTDGGIIVSGRNRWSSGCDYAEWILIGIKVPDASDPHYPERNYVDHMFFAHRNQYEIEDTWYSTGMRGTGSKDLIFDDLFVPLERLETSAALNFNYAHGAGTVDSWALSNAVSPRLRDVSAGHRLRMRGRHGGAVRHAPTKPEACLHPTPRES